MISIQTKILPPPYWRLVRFNFRDFQMSLRQSSGPSKENRFSSLNAVNSQQCWSSIYLVMVAIGFSLCNVERIITDDALLYFKSILSRCLCAVLIETFAPVSSIIFAN